MGLLTSKIPENDDGLVCGPYFKYNAHYGVTGSSGKSLDFGMELYDFNSLGGGIILGAAKPVVKAHGASNEKSIMNVTDMVLNMVENKEVFADR